MWIPINEYIYIHLEPQKTTFDFTVGGFKIFIFAVLIKINKDYWNYLNIEFYIHVQPIDSSSNTFYLVISIYIHSDTLINIDFEILDNRWNFFILDFDDLYRL